MKYAMGEWERYLIGVGRDEVEKKEIRHYEKRIQSLYRRLRDAGFRVAIYCYSKGPIFYLVLGDPWVEWIERLYALEGEITALREKIEQAADNNPKLKKELSKLRILSSLKALQDKVSEALWFVADYYAGYLDCIFLGDENTGDCIETAKHYFENARRNWEQFLNEAKTILGIALL